VGIDKSTIAKILAIAEATKAKEARDEKPKSSANEITFPKLVITFAIFFFLLYLILNR